MPQAHHIHAAGPQYAPPLLRAASPSSSIGTQYGPDDTDPTDITKPQEEFDRFVEQNLRFDSPLVQEDEANKDILIRPKSHEEEQEMHRKAMAYLRTCVRQLEEEELFEQTMFRGSQVAQEQQPSSNDLDVIMRSLMVQSTITQPARHAGQQVDLATSPWIQDLSHNQYAGDNGMESSATTAGKRTTKGKGKSRRG
ncbi:hypothetical protein B0H21DRAFT_708373 [Amylocystis lapponica]|nr:hypothetical protein B0H21DRAFT_708373 [Amylocystis lapponica]